MAMLARIRIMLGALTLVGLICLAIPAGAQQPASVNPTASSVKEQDLLRQLNQVQGRITIPDEKAAVLIQPEGRDWRRFHNVTLRWIGAIAILGMLVVLVVFYLWRGMVRIEGGRSGRTIVRFNAFERFIHWMTATCFIILALSGLNITFGRSLLLPLIGADAFTTWSQWAKYAHNYLSFPFTIGVIAILLMWIAGNIPNRFNAGQKMIYWIVVIGGLAVAVTGYVLMFPFYGTTIGGMQLAQAVHGIVALLFVAAMLGHIYIGTIGMEGAFEAMGTGEVDVNWA